MRREGHCAKVGSEVTDSVTDRIVVPSLPASIASVRRFAVEACRAHGLDALVDTVALLVSEMATNALVHGAGQVQVQVQVRAARNGRRLRVEVADQSPQMPVVRRPGLLSEGGRGLALVESLATDWGMQRQDGGKAVWFELAA